MVSHNSCRIIYRIVSGILITSKHTVNHQLSLKTICSVLLNNYSNIKTNNFMKFDKNWWIVESYSPVRLKVKFANQAKQIVYSPNIIRKYVEKGPLHKV